MPSCVWCRLGTVTPSFYTEEMKNPRNSFRCAVKYSTELSDTAIEVGAFGSISRTNIVIYFFCWVISLSRGYMPKEMLMWYYMEVCFHPSGCYINKFSIVLAQSHMQSHCRPMWGRELGSGWLCFRPAKTLGFLFSLYTFLDVLPNYSKLDYCGLN